MEKEAIMATNRNIISNDPLVTPNELKRELPLRNKASQTVDRCVNGIEAILRGEDQRFIVIVGPCSVFDYRATMRYAEWLSILAEELHDRLLIVMRTYFEKPRTALGWP